jgi:hypothetical protein
LSILCDRLLPGYYSTTMYGTLLDQRVFESLVEKTMPIIWEHLVKNDVQLSVVSLPWFLSLYINSMPLIFAFRVLDVFFLEGSKVLFQVGLAILRINGEELLDATDDGAFISVLKSYFARLGESAHPKSENPKHRAITNFQALMVVAFKEFEGITQHTISEQRAKHKPAVLENIESFAKRTSIRNLGPESKKLSQNDLGFLYDRFYTILYERQQRSQVIQSEKERKLKLARSRASELITNVPNSTPEMGRVALGPSASQMDYDAFRELLAGITKWAVTDSPSSYGKDDKSANNYFSNTLRARAASCSPWGQGPEPADHEFIQRLFMKWIPEGSSALSLQNVVAGLAPIKGDRDIMSSIAYFFDLYDDDNDGKVDREGILRMSEALLFLSRRGILGNLTPTSTGPEVLGPDGLPIAKESRDEQFLSAVSAFIRRCFEYADPDQEGNVGEGAATAASTPDVDLLNLNDDDERSPITSSPPPLTNKASPDELSSAQDSSIYSRPSPNTFGQTSSSQQRKASHNAALDPSSPVHITLPTFRMLVLADETLEAFFDSGFANSFHLADAPLRSTTLTSPSFLSIHSGAAPRTNHSGASASSPGSISPGPSSAGVVAPGKGLRGMLDNIVTDGMRVAAEVRRRMEEAQKELDRGAVTRGTDDDKDDDDDDDEEEDLGARDLLEGAEADAGAASKSGTSSSSAGVAASPTLGGPSSLLDKPLVAEPSLNLLSSAASIKSTSSEVEKSTMFER